MSNARTRRNAQPLVFLAATVIGAATLVACSKSGVSYSKDVQPVLAKYCYECHTTGKEGTQASGFDMTTYDSLMKGGKFGPLIKPGDAFTSALNMLVEGRANPAIRMPHGKEQMAAQDIETLKKWVDEGAKNN
jgi:hypothetical protein